MMEFNKSSNPTLGGFQKVSHTAHSKNVMTLEGTTHKILILISLVLIFGYIGWTQISPTLLMPILIGTVVIGLGIAITLAFKPLLANILAPIYAIVEGVFLGLISVIFNTLYPGIVLQAVMLTLAVFVLMVFLYRNQIIKVTEKFRSVMMLAIGAIFIVYMISFVMSFFGTTIPMIHESGLVGIGFSLIVVTIASLSLLLDFDLIDRQIANNQPKVMEWYGAFVLLVTLIWLYIEILRLLAKLRNR
jgi:uncharacterized YccA/Bax inhibitor family protein